MVVTKRMADDIPRIVNVVSDAGMLIVPQNTEIRHHAVLPQERTSTAESLAHPDNLTLAVESECLTGILSPGQVTEIGDGVENCPLDRCCYG